MFLCTVERKSTRNKLDIENRSTSTLLVVEMTVIKVEM